MTLLSLDVSTSSDQRHDQPAAFGADGFGDDYRPGGGTSHRTGDSALRPRRRGARALPRPPSSSPTASSSTSSPDPPNGSYCP